jgi:hypothetical protein
MIRRSLGIWSNDTQQDAHEVIKIFFGIMCPPSVFILFLFFFFKFKFLQYTIHFINECDCYLKKLEQQYELDQNAESSLNYEKMKNQQKISINKLSKIRLKTINITNYMGTPTKGGASIKTTILTSDEKSESNKPFVDELKNDILQPQTDSESKNLKITQKKNRSKKVLLKINEVEDSLKCVNSIDIIESINSINFISTTKSSRSKSRTENYTRIPSTVELLNKYSSIKDHICEIDKIFKGSSITLTQCLTCENLKQCPETFYDRILPVNTIANGNFLSTHLMYHIRIFIRFKKNQ